MTSIKLKVSEPSHNIYSDSICIFIEFDLDDAIDWYAYHDAPSSLTELFTLEELNDWIDQLTDARDKMIRLETKND